MCEEACPVDAIELTSLFDLTGRSREEMIFDKEKLLSVLRHDQGHRADEVRGAGRHAVNETQTLLPGRHAAGRRRHLADASRPRHAWLRSGGALLGLASFGLLACARWAAWATGLATACSGFWPA